VVCVSKYGENKKPKLVLIVQLALALYGVYYFSNLATEANLSLLNGSLLHPMVFIVSVPIVVLCVSSAIVWEFRWRWSRILSILALLVVFFAYVYVNYLRANGLYLQGPILNNRSEQIGAAIVEIIRHSINILLIVLLLSSKKSKKYLL